MKITGWIGTALSLLAAHGRATAGQTLVPDRPPVLLIHGIADNERNMRWMATHLRNEGREVYTLNLTPNWAQQGLEPLAKQVGAFAKSQFGSRKFDLVGFSMGGLVSRYYVQRLGGLERVNHLVTLSSPHNGTALANWARMIPKNIGCQQMRPGSAFLADLETDADRLRENKFTSVYSPLDLVILPARSSMMPQAQNIRIPVPLHPLMILDPRCMRPCQTRCEVERFPPM